MAIWFEGGSSCCLNSSCHNWLRPQEWIGTPIHLLVTVHSKRQGSYCSRAFHWLGSVCPIPHRSARNGSEYLKVNSLGNLYSSICLKTPEGSLISLVVPFRRSLITAYILLHQILAALLMRELFCSAVTISWLTKFWLELLSTIIIKYIQILN